MVACVKIARTCLLKVTNKNDKIIQNKIIQNKIIQNKIIQNKIKQNKIKQNKIIQNKIIQNKTKNKKQKTKKQKNKKHNVHPRTLFFTHHMVDYIIGQITSFHILQHTLQPSLGKRP